MFNEKIKSTPGLIPLRFLVFSTFVWFVHSFFSPSLVERVPGVVDVKSVFILLAGVLRQHYSILHTELDLTSQPEYKQEEIRGRKSGEKTKNKTKQKNKTE